MKDIIIVGAGPAGLTAAIFGVRAGLDVLVLEANAYGGQIINANRIDNYPGSPHINGFDFATDLYNQVIDLGVEIKFEKVIDADIKDKVKKVITNNGKYETKTIIIAAGSRNRRLDLEKEKDFIGKGLSYCATCDGMFYKNKDVLVYGNGNAALDSAMYLSDICNKVYLVCKEDEFNGNIDTIGKIQQKSNIETVLNSKVVDLVGEDVLKSVIVESNTETKPINVSGIFVAIGQIPETNNLTKQVDTNEFGYIIANEDTHTNVNGVFVAGDIRTKRLRQLVTAVSDGGTAATEAADYIRQRGD